VYNPSENPTKNQISFKLIQKVNHPLKSSPNKDSPTHSSLKLLPSLLWSINQAIQSFLLKTHWNSLLCALRTKIRIFLAQKNWIQWCRRPLQDRKKLAENALLTHSRLGMPIWYHLRRSGCVTRIHLTRLFSGHPPWWRPQGPSSVATVQEPQICSELIKLPMKKALITQWSLRCNPRRLSGWRSQPTSK
jgi:hypothetical protein